MKIDKNVNGNELVIKLEGRLDTNTSPKLEEEIGELSEIDSLIFDFNDLEYISSAGLRIVLTCQKVMKNKGSMVIKNVNDEIKEIFDMTGFTNILTIE